MEMSSDLFAMQGLLSSLVKTISDFTKIRHKGGNEMKINLVIKTLDDYFVSKNYLDKRKSNDKYRKELEDITLFLILNSEFKDDTLLEIKEYAHLVNVAPVLSKCLLANIIVELDLTDYYCVALHKLPHTLSEEVLFEFVPCLKRTAPEQALQHSCTIVFHIIKKMCSLDVDMPEYKIREVVEKLEDIASEILFNISGLNPDLTQNWTKFRIYKHMGDTLLKLLELLHFCEIENVVLEKTIDILIGSCSSILKNVTVDVYCTWAEVQYKREPLQSAIGTQTYLVMEKFLKYKTAKDLLQMLQSIAKKPKTLNEMIQEANTSTIIMKINECDSNQKRWFTALLYTQVFQNEESMNCLRKWSYLCNMEDVIRLLNLCINCKNDEVAKLVIKCASNLNESDLLLSVQRFYHQHGLKNALMTGNVQNKLVTIINKLEKNQEDITKEILLLLLQNPEIVFTYLFKECVKSQVISDYLMETYKRLGHIMEIEGLHVKVLDSVMKDMKPSAENINKYEKLLFILCESTFNKDKLVKLCKGYTEFYLKEDNFEDLKYAFQLYNVVEKDFSSLIITALNILEKCRWTMFEFSIIKEDLCEKSIGIILNCIDNKSIEIKDGDVIVENVLNKFYLSRITKSDLNFFEYVYPNCNPENHAETISHLIKLLPICVTNEWHVVFTEISRLYGMEKLLELITDTLILLCQLTKTQQNKQDNCVINSLKFCIQNYGMILKHIVKASNNLQLEILMIKSVCRILREIPEEMRSVEGMSLVSLLSDEALKTLTEDKSFVCLLAAIGDVNITQSIAKRMLTS